MENLKIALICFLVIFFLSRSCSDEPVNISNEFLVYENEDKKAVDNAINDVRITIRKYKSGVSPFIEDVSSIGSRVDIVKMKVEEYVSDSDKKELEKYVKDKFEQHLFSSVSLNRNLTFILVSLQKKLNENREKFLSKLGNKDNKTNFDKEKFTKNVNELIIKEVSKDISNIIVKDMILSYQKGIQEEIKDDIRDEILDKLSKKLGLDKIVNRILKNMAKSLVNEVSVEAASTIGAEVITQIGIQVIETIGVETVVEFVVAEIPALAVGAAVSAIPGIGPLLALAAIPAVDIFLNGNMKEDLNNKLNDYFEKMEKSIIYGENNNGLDYDLNLFINEIHKTQKIVLFGTAYNKEESIKVNEYQKSIKQQKYDNDSTNSSIDFGYNSQAINLIKKMITAENEQELYSAKNSIESLPKPQRINRKEARKLNDQALLLIRESNSTDAIPILESAHKYDLTDAEITNNLATAYFFTGETSKAKDSIVDTLTLKPDRSLGWKSLGYIFSQEQNLYAAKWCFFNYYRFAKDRIKARESLLNLSEKETNKTTQQAILSSLETIDDQKE